MFVTCEDKVHKDCNHYITRCDSLGYNHGTQPSTENAKHSVYNGAGLACCLNPIKKITPTRNGVQKIKL